MIAFKEIPTLTESDTTRFWQKVDRNGPTMPGMETPCWVWTAARFSVGYGAFKIRGGQFGAHRVACLISGRTFSDARPHALHRCRNRACCNPDHLYSGDHQQNMDDMGRDGMVPRGEKHGSVKLTDEQCAYIRASSLPGAQIARELGVGKSQVSAIRNGKSRHPMGCAWRRKGRK